MEKRNPEKIVVIVYTVYVVVLMLAASLLSWPTWINVVVLAGILAVWIVYLREVRDYRFRALLYSAVALATFALYNTLETSFEGILTTYCAVVVALSILKVPEIVVPEYIFSTFLIVYHGVFQGNIPVATTHERILSGAQILAVFVVIAMTNNLIKRRLEKDRYMQEKIEELKEAEQNQLDFLAHVSRQIMAHLQNIGKINTEMQQGDIPAATRADAIRIETEGERLIVNVNDVLDYSQLESGRMRLEEKTYHPASAINDTIRLACDDKGNKDLELIVDCDAKIPSALFGDEHKLRRVILCLVNNAVKYTQTGSITISFSARPEEYGINLCVRVKDTGIGIAAEELEQLLSDSGQPKAAWKRKDSGIGVGLAISKRLIDNMNGFISAKSELGKGSEFQFVVPQKVVDQQPMAAVNNAEDINLIAYINMEKSTFADYRDDYKNSIRHMMEGLELRHHLCRNLEEFKRRCDREIFTHALISQDEYLEDRAYFEYLSRQTEIIMIKDPADSIVPGDRIRTMEKPFYVLSLASVLNGIETMQQTEQEEREPVSASNDEQQKEGKAPMARPEETLQRLQKKTHINREAGIRYMQGNEENYNGILQVYLEEGQERKPIIEEKFRSEDWENYIIYVHAMKSNSFGIGADGLGEMAKAQEAAGKEGDISYVLAHHEELMQLYGEVLSEIENGNSSRYDGRRESQ